MTTRNRAILDELRATVDELVTESFRRGNDPQSYLNTSVIEALWTRYYRLIDTLEKRLP